MTRKQKLFKKILTGSKNIGFNDFVNLLQAFGFVLKRTKGSHHILTHASVPRPFPVQDNNGQTKPYQVRQFLKLVERYNLELQGGKNDEDDDE